MKIAICDNNPEVLDLLSELLLQISMHMLAEIDVYRFTSSEKLLRAIVDQYFDLIYLDINMNSIDGLKLGEIIRKQERATYLAYMSSNQKYIEEIFVNDPIAYIKKPIKKSVVEASFRRAYGKMQNSHMRFGFEYKQHTDSVQLGDVLFFESRGRKIFVHLRCGKSKQFYGKLDEVENRIEKEYSYAGFVRIHQSYLINCNFVEKVGKREVLLQNGMCFSITKKYRQV